MRAGSHGAELQAFATQAALRGLGYEAEIIDYPFYKHPLHQRTRMSAPTFRRGIGQWAHERLYPLLHRRDWQRYDDFHRSHTALSPTYRSMDELYAARLDYDAYVVGSDQVWNPGIYSSLDPYFLTFAPAGKRKIAYASSFGVTSVPEPMRAYYRERLMSLDAIGVRESDGARLVHELSGREARQVLDPTLLLSAAQWRTVATPSAERTPYVLAYEVTPCPRVRQVAQTWGGRVLSVPSAAGPAELLGLIDGARAVVTDSFHGMALSLTLGKDFYAVASRRKANNSRIHSLAALLGLQDRVLDVCGPLPPPSEIDYAKVTPRLEAERAASLQFLRDAVQG